MFSRVYFIISRPRKSRKIFPAQLRFEIMNYILNVINILLYINSALSNTSSVSVMLCCVIVLSVV